MNTVKNKIFYRFMCQKVVPPKTFFLKEGKEGYTLRGMVVHVQNPSTQEGRQEDHEFKVSICYIRPCLENLSEMVQAFNLGTQEAETGEFFSPKPAWAT